MERQRSFQRTIFIQTDSIVICFLSFSFRFVVASTSGFCRPVLIRSVGFVVLLLCFDELLKKSVLFCFRIVVAGACARGFALHDCIEILF